MYEVWVQQDGHWRCVGRYAEAVKANDIAEDYRRRCEPVEVRYSE